MNALYLILYIVAALFFAGSALNVQTKYNLVAIGLLFWVIVPIIELARIVH